MMKKLLLILLCLPMIGFGQLTYVPDDAFEAYLEANNMGNGIANDDYVTTANVYSVGWLYVSSQNISDLTGIEDFTALEILICGGNQLTSLDVSQNTALTHLNCSNNQLTSLDVSNNTALYDFDCGGNQLTSLDVRNGNNTNFTIFWATNNPNLYCINVDDVAWSTTNWTVAIGPGGNIDTQHYFSNNCPPPSAIQEHTTNKELLKVTDLLGRETKQTNQLLFYIYDDGSVEKKIIIE
jgi:hypothetical protein